MRILLKNGTIINEGRTFSGDLLIDNEHICSVTEHPSEINSPTGNSDNKDELSYDLLIDCTNLFIVPGVIDDQVHFREPGNTHKGNIASESAAAVLGGVTSYMDMPNNNPPAVTLERIDRKNEAASGNSYANWAFYLGADNSNIDQILAADPARICGIKVFMGSSTGNMLVDNPETLEKIFKSSPLLIATHCEEESIIRKNLEDIMARHPDPYDFSIHPLIRNRDACIASTRKAIDMALKHGSRLHILHISTAEELDMIKEARILSSKITGEVCVHYMLLDDRDYSKYGSLIKCNPSIKEKSDREAIINAVREGVIKVVATDHAPHTKEEKSGDYLHAPSGLPLIQHSFQIMWDLHKKGAFSEHIVVDRMSHSPAINFNIDRRGFLRPGYYADILVFNPSKTDNRTVNEPAYKCGWSPFAGQTFSASVIHTFVNGIQVVSDGKLTGARGGKQLVFNNGK